VATSGTSEESSEAGAGNDTDSGRKIILEAITRYCGEKYERLKERDICRHQIFSDGRIITPIFLLSSKTPSKNTLDSSRKFI